MLLSEGCCTSGLQHQGSISKSAPAEWCLQWSPPVWGGFGGRSSYSRSVLDLGIWHTNRNTSQQVSIIISWLMSDLFSCVCTAWTSRCTYPRQLICSSLCVFLGDVFLDGSETEFCFWGWTWGTLPTFVFSTSSFSLLHWTLSWLGLFVREVGETWHFFCWGKETL